MARAYNDGGAAGAASARSATIVVGAVLVAGCVASLAFNLPGHLTYDSILQLLQGRAGKYNNWHPPVMAWMLGVGDAIVPGTTLFVAFVTLLLYAALLSLLFLEGARPSWRTAALALALVASPQMLIYPGIVWKDVVFAVAAVAGFTTLAHAAARWERRRTRLLLVVASFLLLSLGTLARQNGAVIVIVGAITLGVIAIRAETPRRLRCGVVYGFGSLFGAALVVGSATVALNTRSDGAPAAEHHLKNLQIYDLAAALSVHPALELDHLHAASPRLERLLRTEGVAAYTPERIDRMTDREDLRKAQQDTPAAILSAEWRRLITRHPDVYLRVRAAAFGWLLWPPSIDACRPFNVGISREDLLKDLNIAARMSPRDQLLETYARGLTRTPVFSHALYAVLAVIMLIGLAMRRLPGDIAIAGLLASALVYTATYFIISVACDYRYIYYLDLAAMAGALYLAMGTMTRARRSRLARSVVATREIARY